MPQFVEMLQGHVAAAFIVDEYRVDAGAMQVAADDHRGQAVFGQLLERIDAHEQPVRHHDEPLDPPLHDHIEVALEADCGRCGHPSRSVEIRRAESVCRCRAE